MTSELKVALTHDVDRITKSYQCITHGLKSLTKGNVAGALYHLSSWKRRHDLYWNFEDILDIENRYGVKSTFFFLSESLPMCIFRPKTWKLALGRYYIREPRVVDIVHKLDSAGWEIGLHGSWLSYNNLELLKNEKQNLEVVLSHPIIGIRQHYLNLNENTWKLQKQVGFLYDCTWGYNRNIGFRDNRIKPFAPFDDHFRVIPMAVMDSCYMATPNRRNELQNLIRITRNNDSILVINWHSNNFNSKDFPGYKNAYLEIIDECKLEGARFMTLGEYYSQITKMD